MGEINSERAEGQLSISAITAVFLDVLKRRMLIIMAAVIAAMAAFAVTDFTYSPQYRTTATFAVSSGNAGNTDFSNLAEANGLAVVFGEVLSSSLLRGTVMEEEGITYFDGTISASVIPGTNLLTMDVTGSDPRAVFIMAKAIIKHHGAVTKDVLGETVTEVIQEPKIPAEPINYPETERNMVLAAAIAALAVCVITAALSFNADKIRSRTDAENKLGCRVIGEIYHEKKRKNILITNPGTSFAYTEAIHKISGRMDRCLHRGERVIMVTSLLENEGKSTAAVNIALSEAKKGRKILVIDCDFKKPACHRILNVPNEGAGTIGVLNGEVSVAEEAEFIENGGIYLLTAKKSPETAAHLIDLAAMGAMLKEAKENFDFIILDTPPMAMASDAECISDYADGTVLIIRQNEAKVPDIRDAISVLEKADSHFMGCILNDVYGSGNFSPVSGYGGYYGKYGRYGKYGYGKYEYDRAKENSDGESE